MPRVRKSGLGMAITRVTSASVRVGTLPATFCSRIQPDRRTISSFSLSENQGVSERSPPEIASNLNSPHREHSRPGRVQSVSTCDSGDRQISHSATFASVYATRQKQSQSLAHFCSLGAAPFHEGLVGDCCRSLMEWRATSWPPHTLSSLFEVTERLIAIVPEKVKAFGGSDVLSSV
jgi:hypothetical protein